MNHEKLLRKYIDYIADYEGLDYISQERRISSDVAFTDEEWKEIERLSYLSKMGVEP